MTQQWQQEDRLPNSREYAFFQNYWNERDAINVENAIHTWIANNELSGSHLYVDTKRITINVGSRNAQSGKYRRQQPDEVLYRPHVTFWNDSDAILFKLAFC